VTRDQGPSWEPVFVNSNSRFHFDALRDPQRTLRRVSAGRTKTSDARPSRLAMSDDDARSRREIEHPDAAL
jgi:hypothetical protein